MADRADCALRAARAGAEVALERFRSERLDVETKAGKTDLVTAADREAQARVVDVLRGRFRDEPVVGEEDDQPGTVPPSGPAWVVDPIDGTGNFVRGLREWGTSVAAAVDGRVVAGATVCPALGDAYRLDGAVATRNGEALSVSDREDPETFTVGPTIWWNRDRRAEYVAACRGILERFGDMRRLGSTQLELALCAGGGLDGVVTNVRADPWDTLVGAGLVEAAGGTVTGVDGRPWRHDSRGLVASNGQRHDLVLEVARAAEADGD